MIKITLTHIIKCKFHAKSYNGHWPFISPRTSMAISGQLLKPSKLPTLMTWSINQMFINICPTSNRHMQRLIENINSRCGPFISGNMTIYLYFLSFVDIGMARVIKSFLVKDSYPCIFYCQYIGCWWPDDARTQGINCHSGIFRFQDQKGYLTHLFLVGAKPLYEPMLEYC